jgi:hypothetical protein
VGPRGLRAELVRRTSLAGCLGVLPGLAIALVLDLVAVAALGGAALGAPPRPPLVTVVPWGQLAALAAGTAAAVALLAGLAMRGLFRERRLDRASQDDPAPPGEPAPLEELVR